MPKNLSKPLPPIELPDKRTIGERLATFRKEQGLTQADIAESIGINQALVSDYERNKTRLNADMLTRFAVALGISADVLLGLSKESDQLKFHSRKLGRIFKQIENLPPGKKKKFLDSMEMFLEGVKATGEDNL